MKTFELYRSEEKNDLKAVKRGISFPAFFFTWIWALIKGLWITAFLLIILSFALGIILQKAAFSTPHQHSISILYSIIVALVFGLYGNEWVRRKLRKQGYQRIKTVIAKNKEEAIQAE